MRKPEGAAAASIVEDGAFFHAGCVKCQWSGTGPGGCVLRRGLASMGVRTGRRENQGLAGSLLLSPAAALHHPGQFVDHRFQLVGLGGQLPRGGG